MRWVVYVAGGVGEVLDEEWPAFLEKQEELMSKRDQLARTAGFVLTATICFPSGEVVDHYDGPYQIEDDYKATPRPTNGVVESKGSMGGERLRLKWRAADVAAYDGGRTTWILTLPDKRMRSKPVTFTMSNGRPNPRTIVFDMQDIK